MRKIAKNLTLRLSAEEYAALQIKATEMGMKIEPTIRILIANAKLEGNSQQSYSYLLQSLSSIGHQINQIAYKANSRKQINEAEVNRAVALVGQVYTLIENSL